MSDMKYILPYVLDYPIFPENRIKDVKIIELCFINIVEIYLHNFKCSEKFLSAFYNFYNISYCADSTCIVRFKIPEHLRFLVNIIKRSGKLGISKTTFMEYVEFWNKKAPAEKSVEAFFIKKEIKEVSIVQI